MFSPWQVARSQLLHWINSGTENADAGTALVIRRARGFALVAYPMQIFAGTLLAFTLKIPQLAVAAAVAMAVTIACLRWMAREDGRWARLAFHAAVGISLAAIAAVGITLERGAPMSALYSIPLIMAANFVLGVGAAAGWTLATIVTLGVVVLGTVPPPHVTLDADTWRAVTFSSRALVVGVVFALGAVARRFENWQTRQLEFMAHHDSLTGLVNRSEFDDRLGLAIARARRHEWSLALLFIDLDDFKAINDTLGHSAGDSVLRAIGEQIQNATRKTDVAARVGGDEFVVLLEAADAEKSAVYGQRLLERIEGCAVHTDTQLRLSASIGIAHFPRDARDGQALERTADAAMYRAKHEGGGRVGIAPPADADAA